MSSMDRVLSEVQARPYSLRDVSLESLQSIWAGLCSTLVATLRSGKGITVSNFGTWSFHVDPIDLGTQKKTLRTPVFELSEKFARLYNLRCPKQPSGISGQIAVRDLNVMTISNAARQPRELVATALKDIFQYVGETAMSGQPIRLDFNGTGTWTCAGGQCRFQFAPAFAGTFESLDRPPTGHGIIPPSPSIYTRRPRTTQLDAMNNTNMMAPMPPTPPKSASHRPPPTPQFRPGTRPVTSNMERTQEVSVQGRDTLAAPVRAGGRLGTPSRGQGATGASQHPDQDEGEDAQVFTLRDEGLDVSQIEITVRGKELVVRQRSIGMERIYPLHSRVDTERISAKYKKGRLEIRIPDKATALRAFYANQVKERNRFKAIEKEEEDVLLEMAARKAEMAFELEKQSLIARRKARAEVEAFNRKQLSVKKSSKDMFKMPDACGFLLYNRPENDVKGIRLEPQMLRSVLDIQVNMKKEMEDREKAAERDLINAEVEALRQNLAEDERQALDEKRRSIKHRQRELASQIEAMAPRLPGAYSAVCDFPRMDNDIQAQTSKKSEMKHLQEQVLNMVHAKGQQTLEEKRNQYKNDISEIMDIQSTLEQEVQDKMMSDQTTKLQNRQTWREQINQKRAQVTQDMVQGIYATSLPIGEAETALVRTIKPQPVAA